MTELSIKLLTTCGILFFAYSYREVVANVCTKTVLPVFPLPNQQDIKANWSTYLYVNSSDTVHHFVHLCQYLNKQYQIPWNEGEGPDYKPTYGDNCLDPRKPFTGDPTGSWINIVFSPPYSLESIWLYFSGLVAPFNSHIVYNKTANKYYDYSRFFCHDISLYRPKGYWIFLSNQYLFVEFHNNAICYCIRSFNELEGQSFNTEIAESDLDDDFKTILKNNNLIE